MFLSNLSSTVSQARFWIYNKLTGKVVKQGSQARLQERFKEQVSKNRLLNNNFPSKNSNNTCKQGCKEEQNPKQGSEGQVP